MLGNLVHIITFGCQMNEYDSQRMMGLLEREGYIFTEEKEAADIILFNTCSVRESAESRVFGRVWELKPLKLKNPDLIIGICGCMGQQYGETMLKKLPLINLIMGPRQIPLLPKLLKQIKETGQPVVKTGFDDPYTHEDIVRKDKSVTGYVSIMEGCNHACTFCIVPLTRGQQVNRPSQEILRQVKKQVSQGYVEITLLGQNVDAWRNHDMNFGDLLREVNQIEGLKRIRFTSPHPSHITPGVIDAIKESPKVCEWFHLPLQSASDRILKSMKRVYTMDKFRQLVQQIRTYWPDAGFTSDFVVGFPGETEEEYELTLQAVEEFQFDNAFCFMFSPRSGTEASLMEEQLPLAVRQKRVTRLVDLQKKITGEILKRQIGKRFEVMVEGASYLKKNQLVGRTRGNLNVVFPYKSTVHPGDLVHVGIYDSSAFTLFGRYVE